MMTTIQEKAYASHLLVPEVHGRLVQDIENVAKAAGIPVKMVWTSAATYCTEDELDYTRTLPQHAAAGAYGYYYTGTKHAQPVHMRMMALAGACVRNFINAKVMTLQDVLTCIRKDAMPKPTVLFIPNFFISKEQGGTVPAWQVSGLLGLLLNRQAEDLQTYLYVEDMDDMAAQYGEAFRDHLTTYFVRAK